jgi:hypothetical protein
VRAPWACALVISSLLVPTSVRGEPPPEPESVTEPVPPVPPPPAPVQVDPRNYRMVLAGDVLIGLSAAGMITMVVGLGIRSDALTQRRALTVSEQPDLDAIDRQERRIDTSVQLAITGGIAAAVLLSSGISLVAVGYRRERLRRLSLPSASFGPHGASLSWTLRF